VPRGSVIDAPTEIWRSISVPCETRRAPGGQLQPKEHPPDAGAVDVESVRLGGPPVRGPGVLTQRSGESGQTSAPEGLGPRRRAAGSGIGSRVISVGSRSLAAIVMMRSLWWRIATQ
jgi:hypothetical protein